MIITSTSDVFLNTFSWKITVFHFDEKLRCWASCRWNSQSFSKNHKYIIRYNAHLQEHDVMGLMSNQTFSGVNMFWQFPKISAGVNILLSWLVLANVTEKLKPRITCFVRNDEPNVQSTILLYGLTSIPTWISNFIGEFPSKRPAMRNFDVLFDLRLNKRPSKQSRRWWFGTPSHS